MRIAIMQPYFFPYIGYFQLINAVDKFVFYDDVNFIKGGWINRNKILLNSEGKYINLFMRGASSNKFINEVKVNTNTIHKTLKTISQSYKHAPHCEDVMPLIIGCFKGLKEDMPVSEAAGESIEICADYIGLNKSFEYSSKKYAHTKNNDKADRLIKIAKENSAKTYINAEGGKELYTKEYFERQGVELKFIMNRITKYNQFNNEFIPSLSIIDVMMFNSPERIKEMLDDYELE